MSVLAAAHGTVLAATLGTVTRAVLLGPGQLKEINGDLVPIGSPARTTVPDQR